MSENQTEPIALDTVAELHEVAKLAVAEALGQLETSRADPEVQAFFQEILIELRASRDDFHRALATRSALDDLDKIAAALSA